MNPPRGTIIPRPRGTAQRTTPPFLIKKERKSKSRVATGMMLPKVIVRGITQLFRTKRSSITKEGTQSSRSAMTIRRPKVTSQGTIQPSPTRTSISKSQPATTMILPRATNQGTIQRSRVKGILNQRLGTVINPLPATMPRRIQPSQG